MFDLCKKAKYFQQEDETVRLFIEQSPRKKTILSNHRLYDKKENPIHSYYLAFPYMVFVPTLTHYHSNVFKVSLEIGMSRKPFKSGNSLHRVPLPNIYGDSVCLNKISVKSPNFFDTSKIAEDIITDFWSSTFTNIGGFSWYPDYRDQLLEWEELSKTDDMAAFKFNQKFLDSHKLIDYSNIKPFNKKSFEKALKIITEDNEV